jgi:predicted LPLAT superfamily acyltransferase
MRLLPNHPGAAIPPVLRRDAIGLHGDFWTRFLLGILRRFPEKFCLAMVWPITVIFFLLATHQRRAVNANLRCLKRRWSWFTLQWATYRVFAEFALTYMDRMWSLHLGRRIRWEAEDCGSVRQQLSCPEGVLLFTVHSGNFDIGATLLSEYFPRPIHVVRRPERSQNLHAFRDAELREATKAHPGLQLHYASDDWNLGIELCRRLASGEVVAVQGDRAPEATPFLELQNNGVIFRVPKGPLVLAQIARVPCYPIFLRRLGSCHYCITSGRAFYDGREKKSAEEIGQAWLAPMTDFVMTHWEQWFVFEKAVKVADQATHG